MNCGLRIAEGGLEAYMLERCPVFYQGRNRREEILFSPFERRSEDNQNLLTSIPTGSFEGDALALFDRSSRGYEALILIRTVVPLFNQSLVTSAATEKGIR